MPDLTSIGLVPARVVIAHVPISHQGLRNMAAKGLFPAPVQLSPRRHYWRRADIDAWLEGKGLPHLPDPNGKEGA